MGVDVTHLVLEALGDTNDHVRDQALEGADDGDVLPATLPDGNGDLVHLALDEPNVDISVSEVLRQCATGTLDGDKTGLDGDFNSLWNLELFVLEYVPHLGRKAKSAD